MTSRDQYVEQMKASLDKMNENMRVLEAKGQEASDQMSEKYAKEIAKLRDQSQAAKAKLDEIRAAGKESWESMVAEMDKIKDAFVHSVHYFKSQV